MTAPSVLSAVRVAALLLRRLRPKCDMICRGTLALLAVCTAGNAQISDTTAPVLLEFSFTPTSVNAIGAPGVSTVTARLTDDLSGATGLSVYFQSPSGQYQYAFPFRVSGDGLDGVYEGSVSIPEFSESGVWTAHVNVFDATGNNDFFSAAALDALGFPAELIVTSVEDTTAPTISSVTFTPSAIDVSAGSQVVNVALQIVDDVSGVDLVGQQFGDFTVTLVSPSGGQRQRLYSRQFSLTSGDGLNGAWEAELELPQFSEAGEWTLEVVQLRDRVNNQAFLFNSTLVALGIVEALDVTSSPEDTTPPSLLSVTFVPAFINTSTGPSTVVVSYTASDDVSGVAFLPDTPNSSFYKGAQFNSPSGGQFRATSPFGGIGLTSGTPLDGVWQGSVFFPQYSEDGDWRITLLTIEDAVRNQLNLNTSQLDSLGVPRLVIIRPSLGSDGIVEPITGGDITDDSFGDRAKVSVPAGLFTNTTDVAIDVFEDPLNIPNPSGFSAPGTRFVNIQLTPEPAYPLAAPGLTIVLPVEDPLPPGMALSLYKVDEATGLLIPAIGVHGLPIVGTVDPSGLSATFTGIASLSTVVGLLPGGDAAPTVSELLDSIDGLSTSSGSKNYLRSLLQNADNYLGLGNNKLARSRTVDLMAEIVSLSNLKMNNPHRLPLGEANELLQQVALFLFTIPVDPGSTPAPPMTLVSTVAQLSQEIAALPTSPGSIHYLQSLINNAGDYLDGGNKTLARSRLIGFVAEAVNLSDRAAGDPNRVPLDDANSLVQGAVNILVGIALP